MAFDPTGGASAPLSSSPPALPVMPAETRDWLELLKPRVLTLVVYSGAIGLLVAPGHINPVLAFTAILCITVAAGASGALNMWYDRDIDAVMRRTRNRPIPGGRIAADDVLAFGIILAVSSVLLMYLATNTVAAAILTVSILFYLIVYTAWLKRRTPQNIVIGGAAGAFPPVIGWAAVTGSVDVLPLLMFAIIFFWTPPHFWALSLYASADYERAGVPMLPVVAGARTTRTHVLVYTVILAFISMSPWAMGYAGGFYAVSAAGLGLWFLAASIQVWRDKQDSTGVSLTEDAPAKWTFKVSLIYLFALFAALALDHFLWPLWT